jgi:hypothetical protein
MESNYLIVNTVGNPLQIRAILEYTNEYIPTTSLTSAIFA